LAQKNTKTLSERLTDTYRFKTLSAEDVTFRAIALVERLPKTPKPQSFENYFKNIIIKNNSKMKKIQNVN
jgi:hypothetical protein